MNVLAAGLATPHKVKLTVDDFLALDARGAFDRYAKSELIEGDVYCMNAQHSRHARAKTRLVVALARALERCAGLEAVAKGAIAIPPHNAPEPDITIAAIGDDPGLLPLASVRLVIEVSDSTLRIDLGRKRLLYARAGIAEYWVVDLGGGTVHQFWRPNAGRYREQRQHALGSSMEAATIDGLAVALPAG